MLDNQELGGPLFVGLFVAFALLLCLQLLSSAVLLLLRLVSVGDASRLVRWLRRVALVCTVAAPLSLLLAGAVFVWMS